MTTRFQNMSKHDVRLERAARAVSAYRAAHDEGDGAGLRDLLADLMHWCDAYGVDFQHESNIAHSFHAEEDGQAEPASQEPSPPLHLYHVQDGDDLNNLDLFVCAESVESAIMYWRNDFGLAPQDLPERVWRLPEGPLSPGGLDWDSVLCLFRKYKG